MELEDKFAESDEINFDQSMLNFLATQVSTALIFAALARDARRDIEKRQFHLAHARDGYAIARHFLVRAQGRHDRVSLHIVKGMMMLRSMLREMGESPGESRLR